ncbi:carbohydrate ABC transporter permease [Engelhardtia mirabilis]|uniref:sn-glycerol-3-phosphate transport system permease protein UgpE n=1 Tax=Engelhardtia mirabilis TaxID=2528011 RepID=A0A518BLP0_9BACT|nr:L-arabinose transport system permease protein AraQ [Planctomycetes bacterium Pla133]QDV02208.1 L-arabinose transport system permease protein AraQ [Planctomycetes bacterium Pla86]
MNRASRWVYVPLVLGAVAMLFPLWWMVALSLETAERAGAATVGAGGMVLWPDDAQWSNYPEALAQVGSERWTGFLDAMANSIVVTVVTVVATILSSSLVGFGFARMRFRGRGPLFTLMLATMMLPPQVTMIPLFLLFRGLGWVDSLLPLIVPAFFGNAFFIFMFRQFIAQIPEALFEAARIDGCSVLGLWWRILLPMCMPVVAITAVFTFIFVWNDFMSPLIYLHSDDQATLAVALNAFRNQYGGLEAVHYLMAVSVVTMLPCILLFFVAQKQLVDGLGKGAVKG